MSAAQGFLQNYRKIYKNNILPLILLVSTLGIALPLTASTAFTLPQLLTTASIVGLMFSKMLEPAANLKLTADAQSTFGNVNTLKDLDQLERMMEYKNDCEIRQQWWRDLGDSLALIATTVVSMQMLGISPIPLYLPQFICLGILGASLALEHGAWLCVLFSTTAIHRQHLHYCKKYQTILATAPLTLPHQALHYG